MNTYDDLVNDYLHAVEQALQNVPAGRRAELLADLSDHIAGKLAETRPAEPHTAPGRSHAPEVEVRSILDLLGDPAEVAAELEAAELPPASIEINPGRKLGALIWVLITVALVSLLCVGVVLAGVFLFYTGRS
ncbi:HAAS signaling domain-containing protein [Dactylosporangium sp. NPDC000521]|uniref:HAAS signaling domain-containing protein n=1 Tax=Dactylosporangium sp. NPDC000521 TaxID=3363975 RepID=UPI003680EC2C